MMKIAPDDINVIGSGVIRPEGVMVQNDGTVLAADARGQIATIRPDGDTSFYGNVGGTPNGICLDEQGNCIIANIGNGQCQSLGRDGTHTVLMTEANGKRMPTPNFPFLDRKGRLWVSNSSYRASIEDALQYPAPDGCIVLIEERQPRIVAEGITFANGVALNADETRLYMAATMDRVIWEYTIGTDGSLRSPLAYGPNPLPELGYPDGIAFDEAGNLWIAFPALNAIGFITPEGELVMALEDPRGIIFKKPTNICFGWKNLETAFIGSLEGTGIPCFQVPYPGMRLVHQSKD